MPACPPYDFRRPVTDPRLLELRSWEVGIALDSLAPADGNAADHVLLVGERRTGRTSTMQEIGRRLSEERERIVVPLCPGTAQLVNGGAFIRHLLIASVEAIAARHRHEIPPWYAAWRERVYLRRLGAIAAPDVLSSALILASDPNADIDPVILQRDLIELTAQARLVGAHGVVVTLDNAHELTADISLLEQLLSDFDSAGGWGLLLAGLPACIEHMSEAASSCLRRLRPIPLMPFRTQKVMACLAAGGVGDPGTRRIDREDVELARDLVRLTGGNPFEVMLVAQHMWRAREHSDERLALTPRVLDGIVHELAIHTSGGEALREAARAIRGFGPEEMTRALELVALSRLSIREIATARALGALSTEMMDIRWNATSEEIDDLVEGVYAELCALRAAGVIDFTPEEEHFIVRGGRPVSILLKYAARSAQADSAQADSAQADSAQGETVSKIRFDRSYLSTVGRPLIEDVFTNAADAIGGVRRLGSGAEETEPNSPSRSSARTAIAGLAHDDNLDGLAHAGLSLITWGHQEYEQVVELILAPSPSPLALVSASIAGESTFEHMELWEVPEGTGQFDLSEHLANAVDNVMRVIEIAELRWLGVEGVVLTSTRARESLYLLQPMAANDAVARAFSQFQASGLAEDLARATALAADAAHIMSANPLPTFERSLQSHMLSKSGFLKAFGDSNLVDAEDDLRRALECGPGDGWVTEWNLANVLARQGRLDEACDGLTRVAERIHEPTTEAYVLFFAPGAFDPNRLVTVTGTSGPAIVRLQAGALDLERGVISEPMLRELVAECRATGSVGAADVADAVDGALRHRAAS